MYAATEGAKRYHQGAAIPKETTGQRELNIVLFHEINSSISGPYLGGGGNRFRDFPPPIGGTDRDDLNYLISLLKNRYTLPESISLVNRFLLNNIHYLNRFTLKVGYVALISIEPIIHGK